MTSGNDMDGTKGEGDAVSGMIKQAVRLVILLLCAALLPGAPARAAQTEIHYDETLYRLEVRNPELLLSDAGPLLPGDEVEASVFLHNRASTAMTFYLSLAGVDGAFTQDGASHHSSLALLDALELTVAMRDVDAAGNIGAPTETVYSGSASGRALDGFVKLKTLAPDGWAVVQVTLSVPIELGNQYREKLGAIDWQFLCSFDDGGEGSESSSDGGTPPGGGDGGGGRTGGAGGAGATSGGLVTIEDEETPLGLVEIVDDEVPLGDLPKAGMSGGRLLPLIGIAGLALVALGVTLRRADDSKRGRTVVTTDDSEK